MSVKSFENLTINSEMLPSIFSALGPSLLLIERALRGECGGAIAGGVTLDDPSNNKRLPLLSSKPWPALQGGGQDKIPSCNWCLHRALIEHLKCAIESRNTSAISLTGNSDLWNLAFLFLTRNFYRILHTLLCCVLF